MKQKFELEYIISSSPKVLFERLVTADGLSEWFADNVNSKGKIFTFFWDGSEQKAEVILKRQDKLIRFRWLDEEDENAYFEFKLHQDELTKDIALIVTDFADEDDVDDAIELWDKQIEELERALGA